jgi:membrane protein HdeD
MRPASVFILIGALLLVGGILALANPFAASLAVTTIVGVVFLIGGAAQLWLAVSQPDDPRRLWHGFVGLVALLAGVSLLANPLGGLISLTLLLAILFLVTGLARLAFAFGNRDTPFFWMLLISGAASVLIALMVFGNFADAAVSLLGLLLGIQIIAEGVALIALGLAARKL